MSIKHHQANVTSASRDAGDSVVQKHNSTVSVFDTNFSFPGNGAEYYIFNSSTSGSSGPSYNSPADGNKISSGKIGNLFLDWAGGGPEGATSPIWQVLIQGDCWGFDGPSAPCDITFKLVYSGGVALSVGTGFYTATPYGDLSDVLIDDWEGDSTSGIQTKIVETSVSNIKLITTGTVAFRLRYWNRTDTPHLLCYVKRDTIDEDFVLMGASTVTSGYSPAVYDTYATTKTVLDDVVSWSIDKGHDKVTTADVLVFIDNTDSPNAYNPSTEAFGDIKKGNYIEIEAGYNGTQEKRFIGNISGSTQVSRDEYGSLVTLHCESVEGFLLDSKNFNYPNNAMYSYAGYTTDTSTYYEPNGVARPVAFDQWKLDLAIKAVALQAGVDQYYLDQYRQFYDANDNITTSTTKLIRDLNIYLSRTNIKPGYNVNLPDQEMLWVYDFGQDTAYDIIKDMLSKYGYYLGSVSGGDLCGALELIEVESPTNIVTKINTGLSSGYTEGIPTEYAEGFLSTQMNAGSSYIIANWTGSGANLLMGVSNNTSDAVLVRFKVDSGDVDWTDVAGYIHDFTEYTTNTIDTMYSDSTYPVYSYENSTAPSGGNPSVFTIIFNRDEDGNPIPLPYGDHLIRLSKTSTEKAHFEAVLGYDYGGESYKKYSTYNTITDLDIQNTISDIRNDIVVLGAPKGSFAFVADEADIENVQEKYVTARAVDPRSIHDPTYKFYVGRRKQFVIEDPTIVTQERAVWLASHTLQKYRVTSSNGSIEIPCDMGLQVYDQIQIEDVQTGSVDPNGFLYVNNLNETYSKEGYAATVSYLTHWIPPSFRRRYQVTLSDIETYFNNSPIAFEKQTVPRLSGKSGYDPMTAEDGLYIDFEWTLLIPGIHSLEVLDTANEERVPLYHTAASANELVAVPFVGEYEYPGKYRARWDGVHDGYDLNSKYKGTKYELLYSLPRGNGFAARGQNTEAIDMVNPAALDPEERQVFELVTFPLYPVVKFEPVYPEHSNIDQVVYFGSATGTGYSDGELISQGDYSSFDIQHFDLEERQKLHWNFDENHFGSPSDQNQYLVHSLHARDLNEDIDQVFIREQSRSEEFQINNDITHRVMACDPKRPFGEPTRTGYDGRHRRPANMPMIDETVGVRMFVDGDYPNQRRFLVKDGNLHINVLTHMLDEVTKFCNTYKVTNSVRGTVRDFEPRGGMGRTYNYFFRQPIQIPLTSLTMARQKLKHNTWTYLPTIADSTTENSVIFSSVLKDEKEAWSEADPLTANSQSTIGGIGVGKIFGLKTSEMMNMNTDEFDYMQNSSRAYMIPGTFASPNGKYPLEVYYKEVLAADSGQYWESKPWVPEYLAETRTTSEYLSQYKGDAAYKRSIYNAIVVSLEYVIVDRLGRVFYSAAKTDENNVLCGRRNDIEFHSPISRQICGYVNRWDPYLPTACYFERSPATLTHTEVDGISLDNFVNHPNNVVKSLDCDLDGVNLTGKIHNEAVTLSTGDTVSATKLFPLKSVNTVVKPNWIIGRWNVSPNGLPLLPVNELCDGARFGFFGSTKSMNNSKIWAAHQISIGNRDTTQEAGQTSGPWGLPIYVSGGFTNHVLGEHLQPVYGYPSEFNVSSIAELHNFEMPTFFRDGYTWSNWYVREYDNPTGFNVTIDDQYVSARNGLYAFFKHAPVFTLVGGIQYVCNGITINR